MAERPIGDDYRGTLRRAWDRAAGTDPIDPPTPARPVELDPGMVEKARAAFEAMTKAMLDAGRRYEERMNAATTAALSAAGVPALTAEVERLRVELEAARGRVEASDEGFAAVQTLWHAALARATSAEQERDDALAEIARLRAGIEAALAECDRADEGLARQSRTGATFVHERMRALLAGLGEQPGAAPALSAAGVPALLEERDALSAEVERLRLDLSVARADRDSAVRDWRAALARATSAEQERDRLRERVQAIRMAWHDEDPETWDVHTTGVSAARAARHAILDDLDKALAGSGEQPGEGCSPESRCTPWPREHTHARPAPVVPDSPVDWQAHARAQVQAAEGDDTALRQIAASAVPGAAPGSPDVREAVRAALASAVVDSEPVNAYASRPLTFGESASETLLDDLTDAVLTAVGQGVTAEQAWDEGYAGGLRDAPRGEPGGTPNPYRASDSINTLHWPGCGHEHPDHAAVSPTGQEQVPDGGHVLTEYGTTSCPVEIVRAEVVDGKCSACGAVVPDSTDVREDEDGLLPIEQSLASALWDRWADPEGMACVVIKDDPRTVARRLREWLLAVVGQGVTAEQAWDEGEGRTVSPTWRRRLCVYLLGHKPHDGRCTRCGTRDPGALGTTQPHNGAREVLG